MLSISEATQIRFSHERDSDLECIRNVSMPESFFAGIPQNDAIAIRSTSEDIPGLTYNSVVRFLYGAGNLKKRGIKSTEAVAIVLPNGPELALALITCMSQCKAAPLEPTLASREFRGAFEQMDIKHVIARQDEAHLPHGEALSQACSEVGCELHYIVTPVKESGRMAGVFQWAALPWDASDVEPHFLCAQDIALVLRTSGTTSKPKVVPLTVKGLYTGAVCMGKGLALTPEDVCLNVMPYTHIGGISCSLLATIFAGGGSVICATAFDPASFVAWLEELQPTWYYAAPTIHKAVCLCSKSSSAPLHHRLRLVRSGAAHLADADAKELRSIFGCQVLPTYSMTECMPIAQPPLDYDLSKPGSVGVSIASSMRIVNEEGTAIPRGEIGQVAIRGPVVTHGYLDDVKANEESFFGEGDSEGHRWFRTGDVGYFDEAGFIFLTGRSKELIKRGGEQVSPYEVEECLRSHADVEIAVVFGVPNDFWGEEVAAAVILKDRARRGGDAEKQIIQFAGGLLPNNKVPRQIIVLDSAEKIPKTRTGKYIRSGLAAHLGAKAVDLKAVASLTSIQPTSEHATTRATKPHRSIYGLRYILAMWVVFVHFGPSKPTWLSVWKSFSFSMPGYFMLAGFLLASSTTERVSSKLQFYKNRIVAAHPLYLLAMLFSLPLTFLTCPPSGGQRSWCGGFINALGPDKLPGDYWSQVIYVWIMVFFGQLAWPWGLPALYMAWGDGVMWFSSSYYFCLLCFPFFYDWMNSRCLLGRNPTTRVVRRLWIRFLFWPVGVFWGITLAITYAGWQVAPEPINAIAKTFNTSYPLLQTLLDSHGQDMYQVAGMFSYTIPVTWAFLFFLGMLLAKLFQLNHRSADAYHWPHWGILTDAVTLFMLCTLAFSSCVYRMDPTSTSNVYAAPAYEIARWWGGDGCLKLVTFPLCLWIYGLAVGKGRFAKVLGSHFLVTYLSPAAYGVYLFHYPVSEYWSLAKVKLRLLDEKAVADPTEPVAAALLDYCIVLFVATLIAMLCAHKLNAPLTSAFLRFVDLVCCCCRVQASAEMTTLEKVTAAVKGLTGATVDETTLIADCGLDSFGTSALLGVLKPKFQRLTLTPLEMYRLKTIGDLVGRIDSERSACETSQYLAPSEAREQMRRPLREGNDCAV